uniref:Unannotated protein n=1 Tax=freshwater metagenome TaxID=449393 RepID=A0A6J5ZDE7_9ZZZZ
MGDEVGALPLTGPVRPGDRGRQCRYESDPVNAGRVVGSAACQIAVEGRPGLADPAGIKADQVKGLPQRCRRGWQRPDGSPGHARTARIGKEGPDLRTRRRKLLQGKRELLAVWLAGVVGNLKSPALERRIAVRRAVAPDDLPRLRRRPGNRANNSHKRSRGQNRKKPLARDHRVTLHAQASNGGGSNLALHRTSAGYLSCASRASAAAHRRTPGLGGPVSDCRHRCRRGRAWHLRERRFLSGGAGRASRRGSSASGRSSLS